MMVAMEVETVHKDYDSGTIIFEEHEPADCAFIVESGLVEISTSFRGERRSLAVLGPGEMFGEMAALDGSPRSATASAFTDTKLTIILRDQLRSRVDSAEPVLRLLLSVILKRFRREQNLFRHDARPRRASSGIPTELEASRGAVDKMLLESDLREALARDELELHYQPIIDLRTNAIRGFEALIRWCHGTHGMIPPQKFMGIAEETALVIPIGQWVLEQACRDLARLERFAAEKLTMCVNVSARQFSEPAFVPELAAVIRRTGIDPSQLELEITEGVLMDHRSSALHWIEQCRALGTRIAIDDFGTGFSSFSYLARLHIDTLKIDRSFVAAMEDDPKSLEIVRAISNMAHALGMNVIAEGIEAPIQRQMLTEMKVDSVQGYLFSKAQRLEDAAALLAKSA